MRIRCPAALLGTQLPVPSTHEGPFHAGHRAIHVDEERQFERHVSIVRLLPGPTLDQAVRWAEKPVGPSPCEGVGGTTDVERGRAVNGSSVSASFALRR